MEWYRAPNRISSTFITIICNRITNIETEGMKIWIFYFLFQTLMEQRHWLREYRPVQHLRPSWFCYYLFLSPLEVCFHIQLLSSDIANKHKLIRNMNIIENRFKVVFIVDNVRCLDSQIVLFIIRWIQKMNETFAMIIIIYVKRCCFLLWRCQPL